MMKTVSRRWMALFSAMALVVVAGCAFQVFSPAALQTSSQDFEIDGGKIKITVIFTRPVDLSSFIAGTNVILVTEKKANAPVTIAAGGDALTVVITSVDSTGDLLIFDSDGFFSLQLLGSGASPIKSQAGENLDGDGDGNAGGNYQTGFVLLG